MVRSSWAAFAGLLDRSVDEISSIAADARTFDASRIAQIADVWDNNTTRLFRAAASRGGHRDRLARAGLEWMAALGPARRALMVDLDPALDQVLPTAVPEPLAYRDYRGRVRPGVLPVTVQAISDLVADYDLAAARIRLLRAEQGRSGLQVLLIVAAPRRFTPETGRVRSDGSLGPWPAAQLQFTFDDITALAFDAQDRTGVQLAVEEGGDRPGIVMTLGRGGHLRAGAGSVWPQDPRWHESATGRAADAVTPHEPGRPLTAHEVELTAQELAAGRALVLLMQHIRLVRHPHLAARVDVTALCQVTTGAGSSIAAAGRMRGPYRRRAFAALGERWQQVPEDRPPTSIPDGPVILRYAGFEEPHDDHGAHRDGSGILTAAVPQPDPTKPWKLAGDQVVRPHSFRIHLDAFDGVQHLHRRPHGLTIGESLTLSPATER